MSNYRIKTAVLAAFIVLGGSAMGWAASPTEIAAHRQQILDDMLTAEYDPSLIQGLRRLCAVGGEPASVAESRKEGAYFTPDAVDSCVAALVRTAHDHRLPDLYRMLVGELGGSADHDKLPHAIGATVLHGSAKVAIGNNKAATVTPALAFDAGFTVAYQEGAANRGTADAQQLKTVAEACLDQSQDAGTCFSVGYVYGSRAFNAR
jgi:hypothetical protein